MCQMQFDNVIPLGDNCLIASILNELGLRKCAFPFDWCSHHNSNPMCSNINVVFSIVTKLLNNENVELITNEFLTNTEIVFPYESINPQDISDKYTRRMNRFYNEVTNNSKTNLFICVTREYQIEQTILFDLHELLLSFNPNNRIIFISGANPWYINELELMNFNFKYIPWEPSQTHFQEQIKTYLAETIKDNILFVTAYKDIDRHLWHIYRRTTDEYIQSFLRLANNIKYKLIVYVENDVRDKLIGEYSFPLNVIFRDFNAVDTFLNKFLCNDKVIIHSETYQNKIPNDRKTNPEHLYSEYNLINHSKINFVNDAQNHYPNYQFYSWIDFGYAKGDEVIPNLPKNINVSQLPPKIIYHCIRLPVNKIDPNMMLRSHDIYLTGSSFIVHSSLVCKLHELWENKIMEWQNMNITDDDQSLILQVYFDRPELFHLVQNNAWFSLFTLI